MSQKPKPTASTTVISARMPATLVRQIDRAAEAAKRTRTAEVQLRLERSLMADKAAGTQGGR